MKVADFGIAKAAASGQQGLTSEGMTVGTPEYMSPEQAMAKGVGPQSDLYSLGCMSYEMLTGRLPFAESSQVALLMRHVNDPVPDVRDVDPLIPESVALWVARATAKDPDERFADAVGAWRRSRRRCWSTPGRSGAATPRSSRRRRSSSTTSRRRCIRRRARAGERPAPAPA